MTNKVFLCIAFNFISGIQLIGTQVSNGNKINIQLVESWRTSYSFGQIAGVDVDTGGDVYLFHRGDRQWDANQFSLSNVFLHQNLGPISTETIILVDSKSGSLLKKTGKNLLVLL